MGFSLSLVLVIQMIRKTVLGMGYGQVKHRRTAVELYKLIHVCEWNGTSSNLCVRKIDGFHDVGFI